MLLTRSNRLEEGTLQSGFGGAQDLGHGVTGAWAFHGGLAMNVYSISFSGWLKSRNIYIYVHIYTYIYIFMYVHISTYIYMFM